MEKYFKFRNIIPQYFEPENINVCIIYLTALFKHLTLLSYLVQKRAQNICMHRSISVSSRCRCCNECELIEMEILFPYHIFSFITKFNFALHVVTCLFNMHGNKDQRKKFLPIHYRKTAAFSSSMLS